MISVYEFLNILKRKTAGQGFQRKTTDMSQWTEGSSSISRQG